MWCISDCIDNMLTTREVQELSFGWIFNCIVNGTRGDFGDFEPCSAIFSVACWVFVREVKKLKKHVFAVHLVTARSQQPGRFEIIHFESRRTVHLSKCTTNFSSAAQFSAQFGEILSGKYKNAVFALQFVDALKSTTKPFQDRPLRWRMNHILIKMCVDFELQVSFTLSSFEPGPVLTFCAFFHHAHAEEYSARTNLRLSNVTYCTTILLIVNTRQSWE